MTKLGGPLGVAIEGLDLNHPLDDETHEAIHQAQLNHIVLCMRGHDIGAQQFRDFMAGFGTLHLDQTAPLHPDFPEIKPFSHEHAKIRPDNTRLVFGALWHTDGAYLAEPSSLTALYGLEVPSQGGDTQFTNLYAAYDALPEETKARIDGAKLVHNMNSGRNRESTPRDPDLSATRPRAVVDSVSPQLRCLGAAAARIQHRQGRVIGSSD